MIDIKNRVCFYFDDTRNGTKINFNNILLDKKLHEKISIYNISYKTPICPKLGSIRQMDLLYLLMEKLNI